MRIAPSNPTDPPDNGLKQSPTPISASPNSVVECVGSSELRHADRDGISDRFAPRPDARRDAMRVRYPGEIRDAVASRCSRTLRDGVIPELTALRDRIVAMRTHGSRTQLAEATHDGLCIIGGEIEGLRHLINELRPAVAHGYDLCAALQALVRRVTSRDGLDGHLEMTPPGVNPVLGADEALAVYRMVEEAIRNVIEHADASTVLVEVRVHDGILVGVSDDGCGFTPALARPGFGLATMRERAQIINAVVVIESVPGNGAQVRIDLPNPRATHEGTPREGPTDDTDAQIAERLDRLRRGVDAQELECARWAREIHDDALQQLAAVVTGSWSPSPSPGDLQLEQAVETLVVGIDAALAALSELLDDLCVSPPATLGLAGSLRALADHVARDGFQVVYDIPVAIQPSGGEDDSVGIYRIVQEALTNAAKHSSASLVQISVRDTPLALVVCVSDNGTGFDVGSTPRGFGITCMAERADLLGARLVVSSRIGAGTTVRLTVPVRANR
jgi:signal transduction histidine kinase